SYMYDPSGNRVGMSDPSGSTAYTYDPLNQLIEVVKAIQGTTYTTGYAYDRAGNLTGMKYPNSSQWLAYSYNNLNQLVGIGGFATGDIYNPAFTYDAAGNLASMHYDNGVTTAYTLDKLNRRTQIEATAPSLPSPVLALNFRFDGEGNILQRNDNLYSYDALDRLQAAQVKGIFHEDTGGQPGYATGDLLGKKSINTTLDPSTAVGLDYGSSSIGLDFGRQVAAVDTIHLKKDQPGSTYRVNKKALEVLYSNDNISYSKVNDATWKFSDDGKGNYTLTLDEPINVQVVKVHNRYDDRDEDLGFTDKAQFKNTLEKAISAEQKLNQATLEYVYDEVGNRIEERFTRATTQTTLYTYYLNSNRLLTNGKYAFVYDANGNLTKKGNTYTIGAGQQVTFTTSGEGVEYWEYGYDLRNQLVQVAKNGQVVGGYSYDGEGLRVASTTLGALSKPGRPPVHRSR
ncbi:MAG: RHS repeat protein, partial [Firmicutes bacterium]|nr:RHS repeat protein [Bacillota bacterium]